ncbi:MAG: zinc ribbon domain-containing protein, partial [Terriglobia bacterium]
MNARAYDVKTTLGDELKIISPAGWTVAGLVLLLWFAVVAPLILGTVRPKAGEPPAWVLGAILAFAGLILGIWVAMIFYVNADARRRQMNVVLWTLLVIFIPNALGFLLYFLLRQPVAGTCPKCGAVTRPEYAYCPACRELLTKTCPECHRGVERGWTACAFCGAKLSEGHALAAVASA